MEQNRKKALIDFFLYILKLVSIIGSVLIVIIAYIKIICILPSLDFLTFLPWIKAIVISFSFIFSMGIAIFLSFYLAEYVRIRFFFRKIKKKLDDLDRYKIELKKQEEEIKKFDLYKKDLELILEKMQNDTISIANYVKNRIYFIEEQLYLYDKKFKELRTFVLKQLKSFAPEALTLFQFISTFAIYEFTDDAQIKKEAATVISFFIFFISWSFKIPSFRFKYIFLVLTSFELLLISTGIFLGKGIEGIFHNFFYVMSAIIYFWLILLALNREKELEYQRKFERNQLRR